MSNGSGRRIASVSNALRVLRVLAERPQGVGVTELAQLVGVGKSTAHLLLVTLADADFVGQGDDGRYRLGLGAFEVGAAAVEVAAPGGPLTPLLRDLADRSGEAVSLATDSGRDAIIVQRFESASVLRAEIRLGTRMPLHSSASGKYLLAWMPDERIDALFPGDELPAVTPHSIRSKQVLREQLVEVRRQKYARNDDEYTVGISGVATGVTDANGHVAFALSLAGPTHRFKCEDWIDDLTGTAAAMSEMLEGLAPPSVRAARKTASGDAARPQVDQGSPA